MDTQKVRGLLKEINDAEDILSGVAARLPDECETVRRWIQMAVCQCIDAQIDLSRQCHWEEKELEDGKHASNRNG